MCYTKIKIKQDKISAIMQTLESGCDEWMRLFHKYIDYDYQLKKLR